MDFDKELAELQEAVYRKRRLESKLKSLRIQEGELGEKERVYRRMYVMEQEDVDALQGKSLGTFFARLFGSLKEKLAKEEVEAAAALAKYNTALAELTSVRQQVAALEKEYRQIHRSEEEYAQCLASKRQYLVERQEKTAEEIYRLEGILRDRQGQVRELEEAITAGTRAKTLLDEMTKELDSAEGLGTWDLWGGGGPLTDVVKYEHLDKASGMVQSLQKLLRDFRTELADVEITAELQVEIDSFTRFSDIFWDHFFVDWKVLEQIRTAQWNSSQLDRKLQDVLDILLKKKEDSVADVKEIQMMLEKEIIRG